MPYLIQLSQGLCGRCYYSIPYLKCSDLEVFRFPISSFFFRFWNIFIYLNVLPSRWEPCINTYFIYTCIHSPEVILYDFSAPVFWLQPVIWGQVWNFLLVALRKFVWCQSMLDSGFPNQGYSSGFSFQKACVQVSVGLTTKVKHSGAKSYPYGLSSAGAHFPSVLTQETLLQWSGA